jgi:hypothetical protein
LVLLFSQERGFKVVARAETGEAIDLYKGCHALLIGVSDYLSGWPDLPEVAKDIEEVANLLTGLGYKVIKLPNPDKAQLIQGLESFIYGPGQDTNNCLIIYFAGHGHTEKLAYGADMGYVVPRDAPLPGQNQAAFMQKAISMQQIETYARNIQSKHALFLFDSCFSGAIFDMARAVPAAISYKTAQPVRQFITAGAADETVPARSIFKGQLVEALKGEADRNKDGYITGTELGEFLQEKVVNYSRNSQHPQYGKIRDPNLDKGDFVFVLEKTEVRVGEQAVLPPPKTEKVDLSDIEEAKRKRESSQQEWLVWQDSMRSDFKRVEGVDRSSEATLDEKKIAWERFLGAYKDNNPYGNEDEELRQRAEQKLKELTEAKPKETKPVVQSRVTLRSSPRSLSDKEAEDVPKKKGFYCFLYNKSGNFINDYEARTIDGDKVVIDHTTGLMWHPSGSEHSMTHEQAKNWVNELNRVGYAGYKDWRLPTWEEAGSLIENMKMNEDLYIDPEFSADQRYIWTSDLVAGFSGRWWVASFKDGGLGRSAGVDHEAASVRPVRSGAR